MEFPEKDIPFEERRRLQELSFETRRKSYDAHTWFQMPCKDTMPIGLAFVGDPHGDDDGHNVKQFNEDMKILRSVNEFCKPVAIGDLINNWPEGGRLASKWSDQTFRRKDAIDFVRWMFGQLNWEIVLMGNHEGFGRDTEDLIREIAKDNTTVIHKWETRFCLTFPNKRKALVLAAHNFKGHSSYHVLHGNIKAMQESPCHIAVAGHHHDQGYMSVELPNLSHLMNDGLSWYTHLARVRGYKHMDDYALICGFPEYREGASCMAVIDPLAEKGGQYIRFYMNLEDGCEKLKKLRHDRARRIRRSNQSNGSNQKGGTGRSTRSAKDKLLPDSNMVVKSTKSSRNGPKNTKPKGK